MDVQLLIDQYLIQWQSNLIVMAIVHLLIVIIIWRMFKNMQVYSGAKSYVKKSRKLRRKKFSGVMLNDYTEKKRKRNTNNYKNLRRSSKNRVEKYFKYKEEELPAITNFSFSKRFKRNKSKLYIFVKNGKKKVMRFDMKKASKQFISLVNKYECLDEFVQFLHNLPDAILNHQEYDIYIGEHDVSIGYEIK